MPQKSSDFAKMPPDYHAYLESKVRLSTDEMAASGSRNYYRASLGGSSQDYREQPLGTPSRASLHSEQINYPDGDWGGGIYTAALRDDYEKRPKSSYICQTSPQPAIRQRSRSGSGLQEPSLPYGISAFKTAPHGPYSSYTYPRLSENTSASQIIGKVSHLVISMLSLYTSDCWIYILALKFSHIKITISIKMWTQIMDAGWAEA